MQQLLDFLLYWDYTIWYYINIEWHNDVLDAILPYLRNQWTWTPLYLFLLFFMPMNYRRTGIIWCLFFIFTFAISDFTSASLIKPYFHRTRPCNNAYLLQLARVLVPCGSGYSFPSSHAANHFALGIFMAATLGRKIKLLWFVCLLWAILVGYSQIYVGVHFPADIVFGGTIGIITSILTSILFNRFFKLERRIKMQKTEVLSQN